MVDLPEHDADKPVSPPPPIHLVTGNDGQVEGPVTRERLDELVQSLTGPNPWLILNRRELVFAQCFRGNYKQVPAEGSEASSRWTARALAWWRRPQQEWVDDGTFTLEYQDGDVDLHYSTEITDATEVVGHLWGWVCGDPGWDAGLSWEKMDL
ncbi:MAG: hypothetical protein FWE61_05650 [Micrococcales bacterium]|nr:hypothetical protein [Micrococcales bacterium]